MDKGILKSFAVWARVKLTEEIRQRACDLGITEKRRIDRSPHHELTAPANNQLENLTGLTRYNLIAGPEEKLRAAVRAKGLQRVVEEAACSWFIFLMALRFMDVNNCLGIEYNPLVQSPDRNNWERLYRHLRRILPGLYGTMEDYLVILLPPDLLQADSVIRRMVLETPEENFVGRVEVVGWLYQYYITAKKDQVFDELRQNVKVSKENIPVVTQLFTPEWIVKYLVENSLGRLWLEGHPNRELQGKWQYYLPEAIQEPAVLAWLADMRARRRGLCPEDIKVLDPAMGSGHILVYAFDVLYDIYLAEGYPEGDIPRLILEKNLYGLDIDERAGQLAYFALMMKAISRNRQLLGAKLQLNVRAFVDNSGICWEAEGPGWTESPAAERRIQANWEGLFDTGDEDERIERLLETFNDAKLFGSLLTVDPADYSLLARRYREWLSQTGSNPDRSGEQTSLQNTVGALVEQAGILSERYDVVVTNPPYMGRKGMNNVLSQFLGKHFAAAKADLSTAFMEQCRRLLKPAGLLAMINQHGWMFLSSFAAVRKKLLQHNMIVNMVHLGTKAFADIGGEVVQSTAFVACNMACENYAGTFIRLLSFDSAEDKERSFHAVAQEKLPASLKYTVKMSGFASIPGNPLVYWATGHDLAVFRQGRPLARFGTPKQGLATGDNNRFLRLWHEVGMEAIGFDIKDPVAAKVSGKRWFPYNKGGDYRKWYGNTGYVVDWYADGAEIRNFYDANGKPRSRAQNVAYYFRSCISWSKVTAGGFSARYFPDGFIFDVAGCSIFFDPEHIYYYLGLLNSKVAGRLLSFISPTINYEVGHIAAIPVIHCPAPGLDDLVKRCIQIARLEWDSYETSWGFQKHPLITHRGGSGLIADAFRNWSEFTETQVTMLKACEEEINRVFIDLYGLGAELTAAVDIQDITLRTAERVTGIKSFLSYFVGCLFGRYPLSYPDVLSLNEDSPHVPGSFAVEATGIIPILNEESDDDMGDIVGRFAEFVGAMFGTATLTENLAYIAESLGRHANETAGQTIRRYFLKDFYKDHVQTYQKRPVYWLFDSGPRNGFKALFYMHRYDGTSIANIRRALRDQVGKYEAITHRLTILAESDAPERETAVARKKLGKILDKIAECRRYDRLLTHVATRPIEIDLNDGVTVNYAKFQGIEIAPGDGQPPIRAGLLAKI